MTTHAEVLSQMVEKGLEERASEILDLTHPDRPSVYRDPYIRIDRLSARMIEVMLRGEDGVPRHYEIKVVESR